MKKTSIFAIFIFIAFSSTVFAGSGIQFATTPGMRIVTNLSECGSDEVCRDADGNVSIGSAADPKAMTLNGSQLLSYVVYHSDTTARDAYWDGDPETAVAGSLCNVAGTMQIYNGSSWVDASYYAVLTAAGWIQVIEALSTGTLTTSSVVGYTDGAGNGYKTTVDDILNLIAAGHLPTSVTFDSEVSAMIVTQSDCSGISSGVCVDSDDGIVYGWTGSAVAVIGSGSGSVSKVGTPANHEFAIWTGDGTIEGVAVSGSSVVCTDPDGEPIACVALADINYEEETHAIEHSEAGSDTITVTPGMMDSGTNASSSTYWRGDGTWATPGGTGDITAVLGTSSGDVDYLLQSWSAFSASDATPDVSSAQKFYTVDTTTIDNFDDGGDSSTLEDGRELHILCTAATVFDFTSSGLSSIYDADHTCTDGEVLLFQYDDTNSLWLWVNPKAPVTTLSSNGLIARTGTGTAATRTLQSTSGGGLDWTNADGVSGDPTPAFDTTPSSGYATLIEEEDAIQVKYSSTHLGEGTSGLYVKPLPLSDSIISPADADDHYWKKLDRAITVTDIHCLAEGGGTITLTVQECASDGTSCSDTEGAITCDSDGAEDDGTLTDGSWDSGDWIKILYGAPSGTVNNLSWSIYIE